MTVVRFDGRQEGLLGGGYGGESVRDGGSFGAVPSKAGRRLPQ